MGKPSWERKLADREKETRELIRKQGDREYRQRQANQMSGDYLGLEDGHPGIGGSQGIESWFLTLPITQRYLVSFVSLVILVVVSFAFRACVGEERAQEILNESQVESAITIAGYLVRSDT